MNISRQKINFALSLPEYKFRSVIPPLPPTAQTLKTSDALLVNIGEGFIALAAKDQQSAGQIISKKMQEITNAIILLYGKTWPWENIKARENVRYQPWEINLSNITTTTYESMELEARDCLAIIKDRLPKSLWINLTELSVQEWINSNQLIGTMDGLARWSSSNSGVAFGQFIATSHNASSTEALLLAKKTLSQAKSTGHSHFRVYIDNNNQDSILFHQALGFKQLSNMPDLVEWTISAS